MRAPNEWAAVGAGPPRLAAAGRKQGAGFGICISVYLYLRCIEAREATVITRCSHLLLRFTSRCRAVNASVAQTAYEHLYVGEEKNLKMMPDRGFAGPTGSESSLNRVSTSTC